MEIDDMLEELMTKKKEKLVTQEDIEKFELVEELLSDKEIFFHLDSDTAMGILEFLDVKEEDLSKTYLKLTSPERYLECVPEVRIMRPNK